MSFAGLREPSVVHAMKNSRVGKARTKSGTGTRAQRFAGRESRRRVKMQHMNGVPDTAFDRTREGIKLASVQDLVLLSKVYVCHVVLFNIRTFEGTYAKVRSLHYAVAPAPIIGSF